MHVCGSGASNHIGSKQLTHPYTCSSQIIAVESNFQSSVHGPNPSQVGAEGCGKATVLRHCFSRLQRRGGVAVAEVHCSAATTAAQVIDKLVQVGF